MCLPALSRHVSEAFARVQATVLQCAGRPSGVVKDTVNKVHQQPDKVGSSSVGRARPRARPSTLPTTLLDKK